MKIIDAENQVLGRLASSVVKDLLRGESIYIVNAEKAVVSGDPVYTLNVYRERLQRGDPYKGPFFPRQADRILKRTVRGMLPYKKARGKEAFKRLRVFNSLPEEFRGENLERLGAAENRNRKFMTLRELSEKLGGR